MLRRIVRIEGRGFSREHYNFLGDYDRGEWRGPSFRVRPAALLRMPGVVWLPETKVNGKEIYWPYIEATPKSYKIIKYSEHG